jgi:hypothetical protein
MHKTTFTLLEEGYLNHLNNFLNYIGWVFYILLKILQKCRPVIHLQISCAIYLSQHLLVAYKLVMKQ